MSSDQVLLDRFLAGDRRAFDELMLRHEDRVFGLGLRMLGNREDALEATQETFLTVFRKAHQFSGRSAFGTWLYRVAMNTCYDRLRKAKRRHTVAMPESSDPPDLASQDALVSVELRPDIVEALTSLQPEFRSAILLVDLEDLPLEEAAQILHVPVGTVKSRVHRGRKLLAQTLRNFRDVSVHQKDDDYA
ncbi:ECF RNA polymerase sigma factor SigE [bacterium BMS3Abin02]|nr:ECF RNA polymerase sigma factor SigE [bacterium BMS3Abin02]GBE21191.1 ECF RNA polymerase sigma factor SigE [bacterium BMS3Bbin01]HDK45729.1 sigma-70 family RNA polymerase sigma factor [Actinomycetota bacterium]